MDSYNNGNYNTNQPEENKPVSKKTKTKKEGGTFKKMCIGALIGLIFGIFASLGFIGVNLAGDVIKERVMGKTEENVEETKEATDEISKEDAEEGNDNADSDTKGKDTYDKIKSTEEKFAEVGEKIEKGIMPEGGTPIITDVTEVAKMVMPSVVAVNSKITEEMSYFGQVYTQDSEAAGSGIIVGQNDTELLVVTNYHVVQDSEEMIVTFDDSTTATAQVKGTDSDRDLAVIAILLGDIEDDTMNAIAIASLGDSDILEVGEPVVAIGNSLGYGQSVTTGVVSALNRSIRATSYYSEEAESTDDDLTFIQTDAAINPGNSGGALLNLKGEVIGINSSKIGGSAVEGMGYAIPISDAKPIIKKLMKRDTKLKVSEDSKGYLGITGVSVEKEYSEVYGMPMGVYISSVSKGSGADEAGLIKGDIITELNGEKIDSMEELKEELEYYAAGTTVEVTIMQGSPTGYKAKKVNVTLTEALE